MIVSFLKNNMHFKVGNFKQFIFEVEMGSKLKIRILKALKMKTFSFNFMNIHRSIWKLCGTQSMISGCWIAPLIARCLAG
jgi:hypothetical protein